MKKVLFFSLMLLALVACKKKESTTDPVDTTVTDPREAFVGTYDLTIECQLTASTGNSTIDAMFPDTFPYTFTDELTITKDEDNASYVIVSSKLYNGTGLVSGNILRLDSKVNQYVEIDLGSSGQSLLEGVTFPLTYSIGHSDAYLNDNVLTWQSDVTGSGSVSIELPLIGEQNITITISGDLANTATKK